MVELVVIAAAIVGWLLGWCCGRRQRPVNNTQAFGEDEEFLKDFRLRLP